METTTPDSNKFVPAICAYHRAVATFRYSEALTQAKLACEHAPCESEAARWATITVELERKTSNGLGRIAYALGFKKVGQS